MSSPLPLKFKDYVICHNDPRTSLQRSTNEEAVLSLNFKDFVICHTDPRTSLQRSNHEEAVELLKLSLDSCKQMP